MSCRAQKDFGTRHHVCECRAETGHQTTHDCRCGRSWWNDGPPATEEPQAGGYVEVVQVDGYAYVEGKGYVPRGKAYAYQALGLTVDWGTHQDPAKDHRILQYKDDTIEGD